LEKAGDQEDICLFVSDLDTAMRRFYRRPDQTPPVSPGVSQAKMGAAGAELARRLLKVLT
jgi:hypothetical protein